MAIVKRRTTRDVRHQEEVAEAVAEALAAATANQAIEVARTAAITAAAVAKTAVDTAAGVARVAADTAALVALISRDVAEVKTLLCDGFKAVHARQDIANGKLVAHDTAIAVIKSHEGLSTKYQAALWFSVTVLVSAVTWLLTH